MQEFFPEAGRLSPATLMASKLNQLNGRHGFSGSAKSVDDTGASSSQGAITSKHSGTKGFR